jgi:hypothetical protein
MSRYCIAGFVLHAACLFCCLLKSFNVPATIILQQLSQKFLQQLGRLAAEQLFLFACSKKTVACFGCT